MNRSRNDLIWISVSRLYLIADRFLSHVELLWLTICVTARICQYLVFIQKSDLLRLFAVSWNMFRQTRSIKAYTFLGIDQLETSYADVEEEQSLHGVNIKNIPIQNFKKENDEVFTIGKTKYFAF